MLNVLSFLIAGLVTCGGINDTAALQSAFDVDAETTIEGACVVSGQPGLHLPSNRLIRAYGATLTQTPNLGGSGVFGRNRLVETVVGASNITWLGGTFIGSRVGVGGLQWSIGFRVDSATNVLIQDATFLDWYTDGVSIGGNPPGSTGVTIRGVRVSNSKRNALSVTCGTYIYIQNSVFENTNCSEGGTVICTAVERNMPRCGVDFEPNGGDLISHVRVTDSIARNNEKCGWFVQSGMGGAGTDYLFDSVRAENNDSPVVEVPAVTGIGIIVNQVSQATVRNCYAAGGDIGFSFGAGVKDLTFTDSEVFGTAGNGVNFANAIGVTVKNITLNGRPVAYPAGGVSGDIDIKPFK